MKEIKYKPKFTDSCTVLTKPECSYLLIRVRLNTFILQKPVAKALVFAFQSKALGDYFDLHPHVKATSMEFIQLHAIEGDMASQKELRLTFTHREKILLNQRDEIFFQKRFTGTSNNTPRTFTPECIWGIPNDGFLAKIAMTNRFARVIEDYNRGGNQKEILLRFWMDYRTTVTNPNFDLTNRPPFGIRGEFTKFSATPMADGTVVFDLQ